MPSLHTLSQQYLSDFATLRTKQYSDAPRERTVEAHRLNVERIVHAFANKDAHSITINDLTRMVRDVASSGGQSRLNQFLSSASGFLTYLRNERIFTDGDIKAWEELKSRYYAPVRSNTSLKFLRPDEVTALFTTISTNPTALQAARDAAFWGTMFLGRLRLSDLNRIDYSAVSFRDDNPGQRFELIVTGDGQKTHLRQLRCIYQSAASAGGVDVFNHLATYHRWRVGILPELITADGPPPYWLTMKSRSDRPGHRRPSRFSLMDVLSTAAERAALPNTTSHWLLHTLGQALKHKLSDREIREYFGHSMRSNVTEHYLTHQDDDYMRRLCLKVGEIISENNW